MSVEQLYAFALFAFVGSATPGPNNVLLTAVGGAVGVRRGLPVLWGIVFGFAAMIFALAVGLGETVFTIDYVVDTMKIVGLAVLAWLAWQIATAPVGASEGASGASDLGRKGSFLGAALFQWVNPKAWLIAAGAITAYLQPGEAVLAQAGVLAAVFILAAIVGCLPWLAFGAVVGRFLHDPRHARLFNVAMALLLVISMVLVVLGD